MKKNAQKSPVKASRTPAAQLPAVQQKHAITAPQPTSLLEVLTAAASNPQVDIEKMKELFAMHRQVVADQAKAAFVAALSNAQKNIQPVVKTKFNPSTKSYYADLADMIEMATPIYTAEGLSLSFNTNPVEGHEKWIRIVAKLEHSSGHTEPYEISLPLDDTGAKGNANKTGVQATVSTVSYGKRVLTANIFNIPTVDRDGNRDKEKDGDGGEVELTEAEKKFIELLQGAAQSGEAALRKAWNGATEQQRDAVDQPTLDAIRKAAKEIDRKVLEK